VKFNTKTRNIWSRYLKSKKKVFEALSRYEKQEEVRKSRLFFMWLTPRVPPFFLLLPHFGVIYVLLLSRRTATWNLFVKEKHDFKPISASICFGLLYLYLPVYIGVRLTSLHFQLPWPFTSYRLFNMQQIQFCKEQETLSIG